MTTTPSSPSPQPLYNKVYADLAETTPETASETAIEADPEGLVLTVSEALAPIHLPIPASSGLAITPPAQTTIGVLLQPYAFRPPQENPAAVYLAGLSLGSRRTMEGALHTIAGLLTGGGAGGDAVVPANAFALDWAQVRFQHTAAVRAALAARYRPATANKMLAALRGVLKTAWRLGQMEASDYQRACDVGGVLGETLPAGRSLSAGEIAALLDACWRDTNAPLGIRDAAILSLLYGCGLRRAEVVTLHLSDYTGYAENEAGGSLTVRGKRNKERLVPVVGGAARALADWMAVRGEEPGPLFVPVRRGGHVGSRGRKGNAVQTGLSVDAVYKMLESRAKEAQVAAFSPHDCRRTFVGDLLDRGADIVTVQKLAGHANVATTARYDRRGEAVKRRAAELLHVPYKTRG